MDVLAELLAPYAGEAELLALQRAYPGVPARPARPFLMLVDFTYGFTGERQDPEPSERYPLACGHQAWAAVDAAKRLLEGARRRGLPIVFSRNEDRDQVEASDAWSQRLGATSGSMRGRLNDIVEDLRPQAGELVITKNKPSAFFETRLASWCLGQAVDGVIVAGGSTSGCVRATVTDAFSYNLAVIVPIETTFDRLQLSRTVALSDVALKYGTVQTLDRTLSGIDGADVGTG